MAWRLVAQGTPDNFESVGVIEELPHGTRIKLEMDTLPGLAYLANIWGAEWVIEKFIVEGVTVTNAYSNSWDLVVIEGYVNSPTVATIIVIVLVVLGIGGIGYIIHEMRLWAALPGEGPVGNLATIIKWGAIGTASVVALKLATQFLGKPTPKKGASRG